MKRLVTLILASAVLAGGVFGAWAYGHNYYLYRGYSPPHHPAGVAPGKLVGEHFYSTALHSQRSYKVLLPPGYAAAAARGVRFPVLYLLHGSPGRPELFINVAGVGVALDTLVARHAIRPFIVVMPNGSDGSFRSDTEWANTPHGPYESFVMDVVHAVDGRFATKADRAHRGIAGNSAGAYGAVNIALHQLGSFGVAESWSGYFTQKASGPFKRASAIQLRANSPARYVASMRAQLHRQPLRAWLYGGRSDPDSKQLPAFAAQLRAAGGKVKLQLLKGKHSWKLWRGETPAALTFAARHFGP
jgi:enterochelin esterase-like enzyme